MVVRSGAARDFGHVSMPTRPDPIPGGDSCGGNKPPGESSLRVRDGRSSVTPPPPVRSQPIPGCSLPLTYHARAEASLEEVSGWPGAGVDGGGVAVGRGVFDSQGILPRVHLRWQQEQQKQP